jgi:hypothetical protein
VQVFGGVAVEPITKKVLLSEEVLPHWSKTRRNHIIFSPSVQNINFFEDLINFDGLFSL